MQLQWEEDGEAAGTNGTTNGGEGGSEVFKDFRFYKLESSLGQNNFDFMPCLGKTSANVQRSVGRNGPADTQ